ncbi:MAG: precorrin-2 C(20)-methyltransferase [Deltaproteobacteria bacterium]|nr:precorrin-2 C(20)-methyltransferase [Deltaproteobacteria bacterium]
MTESVSPSAQPSFIPGPALFGVGVGPGAPDLLTLRAVRLLKEAAVVAIPRRSDTAPSLAWAIAQPEVGEVPGQERLFLTFPMSKDPQVLLPRWEEALGQIGKRLEAGLSVAFIAEGDPLVYSSFIYLLGEARQRWPQVPVEIIPGVTSLTAAPAAAALPLVDGQERLAVIPASYGVEDLAQVLDAFDTVIITKVGDTLPHMIDLFTRRGCLEQAVYISRATMDRQKVVRDLRQVPAGKCDYFSMVVVRQGGRSGVLMGRGAGA